VVGLRGLELQARSSIEPVSVTAPMLQARAHRAGAKVASDAANQTNTAGVVPSALILRSNIAEPRNDIVEKRLAIRADWSGTVVSFRAPRALRDPAPPARSPWWSFGGAAVHSDERTHRSLQSWRRRPSGLCQADLPAQGHARRSWQFPYFELNRAFIPCGLLIARSGF
jgi:hypothetical protein